MFEGIARRFWGPLWDNRGYSRAWNRARQTTVRVAATIFAGVLAGLVLDSPFAMTAFTALTWMSALAVSTDLEDRKIPSEPVWVALWVALLAISTELALTGAVNGNPLALQDWLIAEAIVLFAMLLTVVITVGGIGSGDVRLVAALTTMTAWTGAGAVLPALVIAALGYLVTRRALKIPLGETAGEGMPVPFAPGLVAGYGVIAVFFLFSTILTPVTLLA